MRDPLARILPSLAALWLAAPLPAGAVAVSSPADLQPAEFWISLVGSGGSFPLTELRDDEPVSIEILDPVVGGVPLTGHFRLSAEKLPTGPATRVNAVLQSQAPLALDVDLDLAAYVVFDLAVLSATASTAGVRVTGRGLGGRAGYQGDGFAGSTSSSFGYVTLYDTNASGGIGSVVRTWEVPGNSTTVDIDEVVSLSTNQLYRIWIRSLASIDLFTPATLEQYAYMFVDPQVELSVEGEGALAVSANVPEALPEADATAGAGAAAAAALWTLRRRGRRLSGVGSPR